MLGSHRERPMCDNCRIRPARAIATQRRRHVGEVKRGRAILCDTCAETTISTTLDGLRASYDTTVDTLVIRATSLNGDAFKLRLRPLDPKGELFDG